MQSAYPTLDHMGLITRKPGFGGLRTTQSQTQPAHRRRLISVLIIRFLESSISKLASNKISIFYLVSEAQETGLRLGFLITRKTGFVVTRPIYSQTCLKQVVKG